MTSPRPYGRGFSNQTASPEQIDAVWSNAARSYANAVEDGEIDSEGTMGGALAFLENALDDEGS